MGQVSRLGTESHRIFLELSYTLVLASANIGLHFHLGVFSQRCAYLTLIIGFLFVLEMNSIEKDSPARVI